MTVGSTTVFTVGLPYNKKFYHELIYGYDLSCVKKFVDFYEIFDHYRLHVSNST